ncbi:MAG: DUF2189 domain-containing protein [Rhodospirillales bacterium]|nr:DUF2189 domain-containing protein [Rhodospirillales bacterium]MBO6786511.1 DUF2189 domain-containing protein [Rhodospirillales bacterium]
MPDEPAPDQAAAPTAIPFARRINTVSTNEPWQWLALGWADMRRTRGISLVYGLIFVVLGYAVTAGLYQLGYYYLIWPMSAGFVLVAPVFAVGIYELSRRLERGEPVTFTSALMAWRRAPGRILGSGLAMAFFLILWLRTAALIYVINFPYGMLTIQNLLNTAFFSADGLSFMAVGTVIGAVFAVTAFLVSAVSLPMMLGEQADFLPALLTSIFAVTRNPAAMAVWAAIIVVVIGVGMAAAMIGLAIALPLIGHATWHAYRTLVKSEPQTANGT